MTLLLDAPATVDSPLARLEPRWKLAGLLLLAAVAALLRTLLPTGLVLLAALLLAVLGRVPADWLARRLATVLLFLMLFAGWMPFLWPHGGPAWRLGPVAVSPKGTQVALLLVQKALAVITLMLVLITTTPAATIGHAARALRVPGLLVQLAMLTYRYVFLFGGELGRLRIALRVRGYRNRPNWHSYRTVGHVAGTLLVRSSERAERVGQAMACRGFDGRFRSLTQFRTGIGDVVFFLAAVGVGGVLLGWDVVRR